MLDNSTAYPRQGSILDDYLVTRGIPKTTRQRFDQVRATLNRFTQIGHKLIGKKRREVSPFYDR